MKKVYIGIDVSKSTLEVDLLDGSTRTFANDKAGHRLLARALSALGGKGAVAVYEPSGGYERAMALSLSCSGVALCMASSSRVRQFARSQGIAAKTDALDAQVITRFAQASRLEPKALSGSALSAVRELLRRRESLVEMVKAETCRGSQQAQRVCLSQGKRMVALLKRQIAELEKEIRRIVAEDADLANKVGRLESVKGIGWLTAATALVELPDLGTMGPRQAAAMAGLAPFARDSGKSFGKRHVSGGNFHLRKALYMPAQCAKTHNAHLRAFYLRLRENGKPFKVAITAVMRKMIVLMNRLLADPNFQPSL